MLDIYIDGDACPMKDETYRVARRYGLKVFVVSNSWMKTPDSESIELVIVDDGFDAADNWVADHASDGDIVITADIPLAARCIEQNARVLGPKGREFTEDSIGSALASRELLSLLRDMSEHSGGPAPLHKRDRSNFLQALDRVVQAVRRKANL